ncbi:unnamed protein product [Parascedosporium putredinis]|uniref:mRNA export factor GLE1 n=1 Tax=Parascedosporium putredinis TaxID=1442378 RepID=A0A9P1H0L3_9PEZI|nr:unnamed protein product [Parascedosporium putredinis]CAI7992925.1 unnamed protein product [Parascedosporium putredinis]
MSRASISSRRSYTQSSPERTGSFLSSILSDDRNTELSHRDALFAAQLEHERVRIAALRVLEIDQLEESKQKILAEQEKEKERLKEHELVEEEKRLRALRAQKVPKPPPEPEPVPEPPILPYTPKNSPHRGSTADNRSATRRFLILTTLRHHISATSYKWAASSPSGAQPFGQPPAAAPIKPAPQLQPNGTAPTAASSAAQAQQPAQATLAPPDRHLQIHQGLKTLRRKLEEMAKPAGSPLKGKMGDLRREIRKSMGQLTGGKGANATPLKKIKTCLQMSLSGELPSPLINVASFVTDQREPQQDAVYNGEQMPSLFIYLLNIFSKAVINQFINECGANPKAADPIGVMAAHIFSDKDFQWRGKSLIDILIAKFRKSCPVLFGIRGSDKTVQGRALIGWRKDGGGWMPEQMHYDRMSGLGAGFAAISLRDFSKANKANPYPSSNYWRAISGIVNTQPAEISDTQYIVLKAMIDGHEQRFIQFFGNAAIAALQVALMEFPKKSPKSVAAGALQVHGQVLRDEKGLYIG